MVALRKLPFWFNYFLTRFDNVLSRNKRINYMHEFQRCSNLECKTLDYENNLIFDLEGALLKSSSLFPYFFLVAFEAGGLIRALLLFLLYPFICVFHMKIYLKIMVFICFFGLKRENLRINRSVLPKFFLEDVGYEGYEMIARYKGKRVVVTDLPTVMVEGFLKDYIGIHDVIGRELVEFHGHYVGFMKGKMTNFDNSRMNDILRDHDEKKTLTGFGCISRSFTQQFFSHCQEIYLVSKAEKKQWKILPKENYPRRLIFHDGRLSFRPTYFETAVMFMWIPFGVPLSMLRLLAAVLLPYRIALPVLAILGMGGVASGLKSTATGISEEKGKGTLYVSNHRTLLDPIYISIALGREISAVTYSISRVSELLSPLKTVRLTRDKEKDSKMMTYILRHRDLAICPEGTTCREPYLLRFSPLFAEVSDDIVPVALDVQVSMFHGTTASGLKSLDPFFFLLNPYPRYNVNFLDKLPKSWTCSGGGKSRFEVANHVQTTIANFLRFECTSLTRKDKYMMLAGNEGVD